MKIENKETDYSLVICLDLRNTVSVLSAPQEECRGREGASRREGLLPEPRSPETHEEEEEEGIPESLRGRL